MAERNGGVCKNREGTILSCISPLKKKKNSIITVIEGAALGKMI